MNKNQIELTTDECKSLSIVFTQMDWDSLSIGSDVQLRTVEDINKFKMALLSLTRQLVSGSLQN